MEKEKAIDREQANIRLPSELKVKLQVQANKRGQPLNALMLLVFEEYIKANS